MTIRFTTQDLATALTEQVTRVDTATAIAAAQAGAVLERFMKAEITGGHAKGTKTGAVPGGPPQNVTGTLRRSISSSEPRRIGDGIYEVEAGPTVIYGRHVDQGGPRWPSGVSYPYVQPGADKAMASGEVEQVFLTAWARAISY